MSSTKNVLVYGWYHKNNVGDNFFADSFRHMFPDVNFVFTNRMTTQQLKSCDAVFIGGGSFVYTDIHCENKELLRQKQLFYIGVGVENDIHPVHIDLMSKAALIATRSPSEFDKLKSINYNTIVIPDIVMALNNTENHLLTKTPKSVLVLPNISVMPRWDDAGWKHSSWNYFKSEFSQFLDCLLEDKYEVKFFPMCTNHGLHDHFASSEIIAQMKRKSQSYMINDACNDFSSVIKLFSQFEYVITQRFHGAILSDMVKTNPIMISHHTKLNCTGTPTHVVSYYNTSKQALFDAFHKASREYASSNVDTQAFDTLKSAVNAVLR